MSGPGIRRHSACKCAASALGRAPERAEPHELRAARDTKACSFSKALRVLACDQSGMRIEVASFVTSAPRAPRRCGTRDYRAIWGAPRAFNLERRSPRGARFERGSSQANAPLGLFELAPRPVSQRARRWISLVSGAARARGHQSPPREPNRERRRRFSDVHGQATTLIIASKTAAAGLPQFPSRGA